MSLETKVKRFWFLVWCIWSVSWVAWLLTKEYFILQRCEADTRVYGGSCKYDLEIEMMIFTVIVVPAVLLGVVKGFSLMASWISKGD